MDTPLRAHALKVGVRQTGATSTLEAAITGTIAATCGTTLAIYAIAVTAHQQHWTPTINPTITLTAPLIGLVTGALAGLPPALKAAQTPPATTLRT